MHGWRLPRGKCLINVFSHVAQSAVCLCRIFPTGLKLPFFVPMIWIAAPCFCPVHAMKFEWHGVWHYIRCVWHIGWVKIITWSVKYLINESNGGQCIHSRINVFGIHIRDKKCRSRCVRPCIGLPLDTSPQDRDIAHLHYNLRTE